MRCWWHNGLVMNPMLRGPISSWAARMKATGEDRSYCASREPVVMSVPLSSCTATASDETTPLPRNSSLSALHGTHAGQPQAFVDPCEDNFSAKPEATHKLLKGMRRREHSE